MTRSAAESPSGLSGYIVVTTRERMRAARRWRKWQRAITRRILAGLSVLDAIESAKALEPRPRRARRA